MRLCCAYIESAVVAIQAGKMPIAWFSVEYSFNQSLVFDLFLKFQPCEVLHLTHCDETCEVCASGVERLLLD